MVQLNFRAQYRYINMYYYWLKQFGLMFLWLSLVYFTGCAASPDVYVQKNVHIEIYNEEEGRVVVIYDQESNISPQTEVDQDVSPDVKVTPGF